MPRLLVLTGVILLMLTPSLNTPQTQAQCNAADQTGRSPIRICRSPEAVKAGDKCFAKRTGRDTSSNVPTALGVEHSAGVK